MTELWSAPHGFLYTIAALPLPDNECINNGVDWFSIYDAEGCSDCLLPQLSRPIGLLKAGAIEIQSLRDWPDCMF